MEQFPPSQEPADSKASRSYRLSAFLMGTALARDSFESHVKGTEHIPKVGPYVIGYTHHASWWDIPLFTYPLYKHDGSHIDVMGKRPLMKPYTPWGLFLRSAGGFGVSQGKLDVDVLMEGYHRLEAKRKVGIAVEGRGVREPEKKRQLDKVSSAMGLLMCMANVQTVPVAIAGNVEDHYIAGKKITVVRKSLVKFGQPIQAPEGAGQFDLSWTADNRRPPKDLAKMSKHLVKDIIEPSMQELYAGAWANYDELYGQAA